MDAALNKRMILYAKSLGRSKGPHHDKIDQIVHGRGDFHKVVQREFCFLQLRLLCELVALSCLVAHGTYPLCKPTRAEKKAYSADEIMKKLEELRPHFYPLAFDFKEDG